MCLYPLPIHMQAIWLQVNCEWFWGPGTDTALNSALFCVVHSLMLCLHCGNSEAAALSPRTFDCCLDVSDNLGFLFEADRVLRFLLRKHSFHQDPKDRESFGLFLLTPSFSSSEWTEIKFLCGCWFINIKCLCWETFCRVLLWQLALSSLAHAMEKSSSCCCTGWLWLVISPVQLDSSHRALLKPCQLREHQTFCLFLFQQQISIMAFCFIALESQNPVTPWLLGEWFYPRSH